MFRNSFYDSQDTDAKRKKAAQIFFRDDFQFHRAVAERIFPGVVLIETESNKIGMGFFQFEKWLVSNAHVIQEYAEIEGSFLTKYDNTILVLEAEQAFLRPWENLQAPDLAVIKTITSENCIPQTVLSADETYDKETRYFYVDRDFGIRPLSLASRLGEYPLFFSCDKNDIPPLGCSGTPIFSAKVILGKKNSWKFELLGALYARCDNSAQSGKLVCAMPIQKELEQIRSILVAQDASSYFQQRAQSSVFLGDKKSARENNLNALQDKQLATAGFKAFESGESPLEITLPPGLEKLAGSTLLPVRESYLIKFKKLTVDEAQQTFDAFIREIEALSLFIRVPKETTIYSSKYWRLDCKPGHENQYWILQVQDNTGKGVKVPGKEKSASSVFAEVKVPKVAQKINGLPLAQDLLKSQAEVVKKAALHANLKDTKGDSKKMLATEIGAIKVSIIAGQASSCSTLEEYQSVTVSLPTDQRSRILFAAMSADATSGADFAVIAEVSQDPAGVNCVNEVGDTPLMVLLANPKLHENQAQLNKASMLVEHSLWTKPNKDGKTAEMMLNEHPGREALKEALNLASDHENLADTMVVF